jgi:hypothetical protein
MSVPLGDLAESVAKKMVTDTAAPVVEASVIAEEAALQAENALFTKIRFSWRPEDRAILDRIRISAEAMFEEAFTDAITVIDEFYAALRVPRQREVDGVMVVVKDATGRIVWETDELGKPVERWSQLTGQDVEQTLANLDRFKFSLSPQVNQLMLEALYARHVAGDVYDQTWGDIMDGTQGDKTAKSNKESRVDRYHAYFRFYLYSVADTFLKEVNAFIKHLENIRYWQVRSQR